MTALFQATLGNRAIPDGMIGWEPVARAVRLILGQNLDVELVLQADKWKSADLQMQELGYDPQVGQVDLEPILLANIHEGPKPTLIEAPPEAFPNIAVVAYQTRPSASQAMDQFSSNDIMLIVETMVKAGPISDLALLPQFETIVHRRIQRTTEAVHEVLRRDATLMGTVSPQRQPPGGGIDEQAWIASTKNEAGRRFIRHGSVLQYTLKRLTT